MQIHFQLLGLNKSKMQIEHTDRSMEDKPIKNRDKEWWRYGDQQDASTNKDFIRSATHICHTTLRQPRQEYSTKTQHQERSSITIKREENAFTHCVYNELQVSPIYRHMWGRVTHILCMWAKSSRPCTYGINSK